MYHLINMPFFLFWTILQIPIVSATTFAGKDVTSLLFKNNDNEDVFPMAYGDFNADKLTDVFAVTKDRSTIMIYFGASEPPLLRPAIQCKLVVDLSENGYPGETSRVNIVGITPGDFNGDGLIDVMIAFRRINVPLPKENEPDNPIEIIIFKGNGSHLDCSNHLGKKPLAMAQEPLMLDLNNDMVMDLFGEISSVIEYKDVTTNQTKHIRSRYKHAWFFNQSSEIGYPLQVNLTHSNAFEDDKHPEEQLAVPHSCAFVDSNGDLAPELVFITESRDTSGKINYTVKTFHVHMKSKYSPSFKLARNPVLIDKNRTTQVIGQSIFMDMNHDGILDHIIPTNSEGIPTSTESYIYVIPGNSDEAVKLSVDFTPNLLGIGPCHFMAPKKGNVPSDELIYSRSIVLRPGDFNLDGYPDLIGVLQTIDAPIRHFPVLFENVPCDVSANKKGGCQLPRSFKINFEDLSRYYQNVSLATFFDIHEDGLVDVLLVREVSSNNSEHKYGVFAFQNSPDYDANFMKVMVLTGNECSTCPDGIPYGAIIPGPVVQYTMTTEAGFHERAIAAQLYRTSFQAMDLPYIIFGIGQSPNFVETLTVSVFPTSVNKRTHEWLQIIPNSQILVVPSPLDTMSAWKAKLFLTPSKARVYTFATLVGFCGIIFVIVAFLQYKEKREDRKERLDAHRFHMM